MSAPLRSRRVGLSGRAEVSFGHHDPHQRPIFKFAYGVNAEGVVANAPFRLLGYLGLGDKGADRRIPPREFDSGCLTDQTASSVAADEIFRVQRRAVGQFDVNADVVLRETRDFASAIDWHRQLVYPTAEYALDMVLPKPQPVIVSGGKVAYVQDGVGETADLSYLPLRKESISNSALIEDLDGA
jgi:hypothetical protein